LSLIPPTIVFQSPVSTMARPYSITNI
jgi:hypothetical protein